MNSRSILLAGAMTVAPWSAALSADAVFAPEPEPAEYVRVCDTFGEGFFYIPGTETCLQISGEIYYQIGATSDDGVTDTPNYFGYTRGWNKNPKATVNFDARTSTEWGVLQSFIAFEADWDGQGDGPVVANQAWLSLGGLRMGYSESTWADSIHDLAVTGTHSDGGLWYGDQNRAFIQYNFGGSQGLFGTLALEDDGQEGEGYMPDVVALVGYQQAWGGVWARLGYDESYGDPAIPFEKDGFGVSAGVQLNVPGMEGSSFRLIGYYADGDHVYGTGSSFAGVTGYAGNAEWSVLASYQHQFSAKLSGSVGFQYFNDFYVGGTDAGTGLDGYTAEASLVWLPVENFEVRGEGVYDKIDTRDGSVAGYLRFTRFF